MIKKTRLKSEMKFYKFLDYFTISEIRRRRSIKKGFKNYFPYKDNLLCLSVEETTREFFKGLY